MARPTKYTPELLEAAYDYLNGGYKGKDGDFVIPSRQGLAYYLQVSDSTIDNWENDTDKPEFLGILNKIRQKQHDLLINKGLTGEFNAAIAKLVLGKHGYSEKHDHRSGDKSMSPPSVINIVPANGDNSTTSETG